MTSQRLLFFFLLTVSSLSWMISFHHNPSLCILDVLHQKSHFSEIFCLSSFFSWFCDSSFIDLSSFLTSSFRLLLKIAVKPSIISDINCRLGFDSTLSLVALITFASEDDFATKAKKIIKVTTRWFIFIFVLSLLEQCLGETISFIHYWLPRLSWSENCVTMRRTKKQSSKFKIYSNY